MDQFTSRKNLFLGFSLVIVISVQSNLVASATITNENDVSYNIGPELEKELRLSKTEKDALDKLKLLLPKEPGMPYLQMDLFQIRWLRAQNLDVDRTLRELKELIQLRRKHKVPNFWNQDWSDLFQDHPFAIDGFDREGRPIIVFSISKIDLRKIMIQGKREKSFKYCMNIGIAALDKMVEINRKHANITQVVFIANLEGFNTIQHTCPLCLQFYIFILELNEVFLPGFTHDVIIINAPSIYGVFLEIMKPFLSEHTRSVLQILGTNKSKWKPYLDAKIDPKQLTWELGGTKVTDDDY